MSKRTGNSKITRSAISVVQKNLESDTPKYEDKAIKEALLLSARHYSIHGDRSPLHRMVEELPEGTWKMRAMDYVSYVLSHDKKWIKNNFCEIRKKLEELSKTAGYGKSP